jgi:transcriptional regulator with XRE-family HTH domain
MEMTNEKLRQQFSARLKKEFQRAGLPVSSPTQIAQEFNRRYPATQVTAQTLRKWLLAEAIPTQAKLIALADWLAVSPQWLRFGTGARRTAKANEQAATEVASHSGVIVIGKDQAALVSLVELLTQLSSGNLRLMENIVRCVLDEQVGKLGEHK